jgi:hypothetical protein
MVERAPLRRGISLAVASAAVIVGHHLAYLAAFPDPAQRNAAIVGAGHGYLGFLTDVAILLAGAGAASVFLSRLTRPGGRVPSLGRLSARLTTLQAVAFVTMEVAERVASGASVGSVFSHGLLPIGVGVQALVAVVAALLIRLTLSAADEIALRATAALTLPPRRVATLVPPPLVLPALAHAGPFGARAPPASSF